MVETNPPDTICPDYCWSCHHKLPKNRIDSFESNFFGDFETDDKESRTVDPNIFREDDVWEYEPYDPNDFSKDAIGMPIQYYGTGAKPVPSNGSCPAFVVRKKKRSEKHVMKPARSNSTNLFSCKIKTEPVVKTFSKKEKIAGPGVLMLQDNFKHLKKALANNKSKPQELFDKYQNCLEGEVSKKDAFDMVRSLSSFRHLLADDYDQILELLVKDFE